MSLRSQVERQFPTLFITLLSVLIGLVFADLFGRVRARVTLWPFDLATFRTWGQIFASGFCAFAVWVVFAHIGISRRHIPTLADSVIVFVLPVPLMVGSSLAGRSEIWPWYYFAIGYLVICAVSTHWQIAMATRGARLGELCASRPAYRADVAYLFWDSGLCSGGLGGS